MIVWKPYHSGASFKLALVNMVIKVLSLVHFLAGMCRPDTGRLYNDPTYATRRSWLTFAERMLASGLRGNISARLLPVTPSEYLFGILQLPAKD